MFSAEELYSQIRSRIPSNLGSHGWYIVTASSLIACGKPEELSSLYVYATGPDSPLTTAEKEQLSRRLQDVLAKAWTLVGIPLVVLAAAALAKVEARDKIEDAASKWQPPQLTPETTERGTAFMQAIYKDNLDPIFSTLGSNAPLIAWLDKAIVYGLFLADHTLLSPVESELVTLPAIMCQGLRSPTLWHLRGLRRLGVAEADVEQVQIAIEIVAKWAGKDVGGWPRAEDVRQEV